MNTKSILALAAFAAVASTSFAGEADPSGQFALQIEGQRTRAEVKAEAAQVPANKNYEPAGSRVLAQPKSALDAATVRAQAIEAVRLGQTASRGEASLM